MPNVVRVLELSTAHVPAEVARALSADTIPGTIVFDKGDHGWLVLVDLDLAADHQESYPAELLAVQRYAWGHRCDWIMFDADAEADPELPTWEW